MILLFLFTSGIQLSAQNTTYQWDGSTNTAWNDATNWTKLSGTGTTFPGNGGTGDIVIIPGGITNQPTLSTALPNSVASVRFSGTGMTLTITGQTLTVTGLVSLDNLPTANLTATITGSGTLSCGSFTVGGSTAPTTNNTTTTATITNTTLIVSGSITLRSNRVSGSVRNNATISHNGSTITASNITTQNTGTPTSTYTMTGTTPILNLTGATPFTLAGTGTNTFTLNSAGATVDYQSSSNVTLPTATGLTSYVNLIISGGGGNVKTAGSALTVSGALTVRAASTLALGTNTLATPTSITLETVGGGNGAAISGNNTTGNITLGGNITVNYTGSGIITTGASIAKPIALGANRSITVADDGFSNADLSISGVISGAFTLTKNGNGAMALSGANSYSGVTTISAGAIWADNNVAVSTAGPLGNANTAVVLGDANTTANNSSPSLMIDGAFTFARAVTIANQATSGTYSIGGTTDNNATFSGTITFSRPFTITQVATTSTNTLTISGTITGGLAGAKNITFNNEGSVSKTTNAIADGTGTTAVIKSNTGVLTMGVANSYTAGTTLNDGILNINNTSSLGTVAGTFTINGGTIQNTTGASITTNNHPMTWNGDFSFVGSQPLNLGSGTVTMGANVQITTGNAGVALTVQGGISAATRSLTKAGPGTLNFTNQTITLNNLSISAGILTASSGTMNIAGAFTNDDTFANNGGTVVMNNAASAIVNNSTLAFDNLTISVTPTGQSQYNASYDVEGNLTVSGGVTFAPTGGTITMSNAASAILNSGTITFSSITIGATPTAQSQYNASYSVSGTLNISGGVTFAPTGGTITMSNAASSIANSGTTTFQNLIIAVTPTAQSQYNTSFSVAAAFTVNGGVTFAPTGGTITMSAVGSSIANTGTKTFNNLTIAATPTAQSQYNTSFSVAGILTINGGITFAPTGGTITMSNAASSIANSGTATFQNLIIAVTPTAQTQYNTSFNIAATFTVSGGVTFAPTSGTITMNNAASAISNGGSLSFNNLTISATPTAQSQYNTSFSVGGTLATSGAITFAPTGGTITMSGSAGSISNASGTLTFNNLTVSGTTVSSTGNFAVAGTMSVTGVFNPAATSIISGAGTLTGTGTVNVTRTAATPSFGAQYTITTKTLANLTVDFNGAGAQTVDAQDYGTLVISTNGTRTVTFVNGGTIRVSNVFTPTATTTTYVVTGNTFEYNGSGAQTITAFTYNNLIISNAGTKTVLAGTTVNCQTVTINDNAVLTLPDTSVFNVQG